MKICLVGPGIMSIPPPGWGAVEILIWDYYQELKKLGHEVVIVNKMRKRSRDSSNPNCSYIREMIKEINQGDYDFVHLHYDCHYHIMDKLTCPKIGITSHYPYIDQINRHRSDGFGRIFKNICQNKNHIIFALSRKDKMIFENKCQNKNNIVLMLNGSNSEEITPLKQKKYPDRSIYIGKIEERKKQYKYSCIDTIHFFGKCDTNFKKNKNYKGEVNHKILMKELCEYGNKILLSDGENGTPLVIKEALMAGLPVVISESCSDDIDKSLEFIDIIPNEKLNDIQYIKSVILENLKKQVLQDEIRNYAVKNFCWKILVKTYIENVSRFTVMSDD